MRRHKKKKVKKKKKKKGYSPDASFVAEITFVFVF